MSDGPRCCSPEGDENLHRELEDRARMSGVSVLPMTTRSLDIAAVQQLLRDTLSMPPDQLRALAEVCVCLLGGGTPRRGRLYDDVLGRNAQLLMLRTQGSPLHIKRLLTYAQSEGHIVREVPWRRARA